MNISLSSEQELGTINFLMFYIKTSPSNIAYTMSSLLTNGKQADNKQKDVALQTMQYQADKVLAKIAKTQNTTSGSEMP